MIVSNIIAIAQKELQSYFASPLAYVLAAIFWFFSGFFFVEILIGKQGLIQQVALKEQTEIVLSSVDVATEFLNAYSAILGTLSLLIIPILSMGLYAEEKKQGTIELLATSPLNNWVVALGKLIGVTLLFIFMLLPSLFYEAITFSAAEPPIPPVLPLLAHLGLVMMAVALLSIGMFISSLTTSNLVAAILTFSIILFLWIIDLMANNIGGWLGNSLEHISLLESYNNLVRGIINTSDFVLFFSYIFIGLFLTSQSIELFRLNHQ
ncbi:ABC transporter permease subunit [Waterburya agarophytonicola K14]|uniref:ABC transporter permease subunit n=1 Tax=Waterburya agarophytonicola KI4 TaxID=2874699 RepID=A0A964BSD9_9CYAN|nr:ABC transporter permease [Waterburya agarophytonicola]MCC0177347.1 ABC transporter permease subunit [Waterburya agarophytonicola KI4]